MKVKELIERLKKLDQEKEVLILNNGDNPFDNGYPVKKVFEINGSETDDYVFMENE